MRAPLDLTFGTFHCWRRLSPEGGAPRRALMTNAWQDVVYGFRMLLRKPGFTIVAALSLALGIGANTLIFSLINTTLLRPLPYADPDRLVEIWSVPLDHKDQRNWVLAYNLL